MAGRIRELLAKREAWYRKVAAEVDASGPADVVAAQVSRIYSKSSIPATRNSRA